MGPLYDVCVIQGREYDAYEYNGCFVTDPSSTVCTVNPSIQDPSGRVDGWSPGRCPHHNPSLSDVGKPIMPSSLLGVWRE